MKAKNEDIIKYIQTYLPFLCDVAKKKRGLYKENITLFIFNFMKSSEKFNENHRFRLKDWDTFLDQFKVHMVEEE